jgi:hypothetical protein
VIERWLVFFWVVSVLLIIGSDAAYGREFSYGAQSYAGFIRGGLGLPHENQDAFAHSSGSQTRLGDESPGYNVNGEIGFQYSAGPFNFRFGYEALRAKEVEVVGSNAAGARLMDITSNIFTYGPKLTIEYIYSTISVFRFYGYAAGTYNFVSLDNEYTLTAVGTGTYAGMATQSTFVEKSATNAYSAEGGLGIESVFADNATFSLDCGYRYFPVSGFRYRYPVTVFDNTSVGPGELVRNQNGTTRTLDLGGITASITFRFYLGL